MPTVCPKDLLKDTNAGKLLEKNQQAVDSVTGKKWWRVLWKAFYDHRVNLHRELDGLGPDGHRIRIGLDNSAGGATQGLIETNKMHDRVLKGLTRDEYRYVGENILLRRIIKIHDHRQTIAQDEMNDYGLGIVFDMRESADVDKLAKIEYIGKDKADKIARARSREKKPFIVIKKGREGGVTQRVFATRNDAEAFADHEVKKTIDSVENLQPFGLTAEDAHEWRKKFKEKASEQFDGIEKVTNEYFAVFAEQLKKLRDSGLISEAMYDRFAAVGDYSPKRYIKFIDPDDTYNSLMKMDKGSTSALLTDPAQLMKDYIVRLNDRIARNDAAKGLYDYAKKLEEQGTDNGFVRIVDPKEPSSDNIAYVNVIIDGEQQRMVFKGTNRTHSNELVEEWNGRDPVMQKGMVDTISSFFGVPLLRASATGMNPGFAATNTPRDAFFSWFRTDEYHHFAPIGFSQMATDMARVAWDVWWPGRDPIGASKLFFDHRGALEFMTTQGYLFQGQKRGVLHPKLKAMERAASYFGQRSELWIRVSLMQRAIRNLTKKHPARTKQEINDEAAWIARSYLDFAQGGNASKFADKFIPYFNVGMISTRGIIETFKKDPAMATWKSMQFTTIFLASAIGMMLKYPEIYQAMSDRDRQLNIIIPMPFRRIEGNNVSWPVFKIAMDQGQAALASAYTYMLQQFMGELRSLSGSNYGLPDAFYNLRSEQLFESIKPIIPFIGDLPPLIRGIIGWVSDYDLYWNNRIWGSPAYGVGGAGQEYDHNTNMFFRYFASAANAMLPGDPVSPVKLRYLISQFITPSNFFVKAADWGTDVLDSFTDKSEKEEMSKIISDSWWKSSQQVPGLSRLVEVVGYETGGNQEFVHQRDNSRNSYNLTVDGARKNVNFFLDQYDRASHFRDEDKYLSAARDAANESKNTGERDRHLSHIKFAQRMKKRFGSGQDDRDFWRGLYSDKNDYSRANSFHRVYKGASGRQKMRLNDALTQYPEITRGKFYEALRKYRMEDGME